MNIPNHPAIELRIVYRDVGELYANPDHALLHPKKQLAQIRTSLRTFGFLIPLVIDGSGMVLCGHGRLEAARDLGMEKVPTIEVCHLSEAELRAFVLADNKVAEGAQWDERKLAIELETILELDRGFEIDATGFEIGEVDHLIELLHKPRREDEVPFAPERVESVCGPGDLWLLGKHGLFCGDALDPLSYEVLLGREKAGMVITDPPYNIEIEGFVSGLGKVKHADFVQASGEMSGEEFLEFLVKVMRCMKSACIDGALFHVFMGWQNLGLLLEAGDKVFDEYKGLCVWDKLVAGMGGLYRNQLELVGVFKSGKSPHVNNIKLGANGRNRSNVWSYPGLASFGRGREEKLSWHPTVKPTAMIADAILDCSNPGSIILDPFAGSGTTAIACERTHRRAMLIELDPRYCDVILRRFCDATGIEPVNAWTGQLVQRKPSSGE